jgi:hypothetical protein
MRINGAWVGWGLGDVDPKVGQMKQFLLDKFQWVRQRQPALTLDNTYDATFVSIVAEMQRRYGIAVNGLMNAATQAKCGFHKPGPQIKPVFFTVEGHMSNMFAGPCAATASQLESEGLCHWQPIGYDDTALPFDNASGINELNRLVCATTLDNGTPFPAGTPWFLSIFSQGGIVGSQWWTEHVLPENGSAHFRLQDWRGTIAHGNPWRENNVVAGWVPDGPNPNTQGISNRRLVNTPANWKEVCRHGDLYAENTTDEVGMDKTAIYEIVMSQFTGDPSSIIPRLEAVVAAPLPEIIIMFQAIISGVLFLGDMDPHGHYDLGPGIDFARARLTAAAPDVASARVAT